MNTIIIGIKINDITDSFQSIFQTCLQQVCEYFFRHFLLLSIKLYIQYIKFH